MARGVKHSRTHDPALLIRRWRPVARKAGLVVRRFARAHGHDLFYIEPRRVRSGVPTVYLSAGIHGDEPGATEGLLSWAERNPALLEKWNVLIFPCLNPWGLANNCRLDKDGKDLNRSYNDPDMAQIQAQLAVMKGRRFDLALTLHEDYDAEGIYLYEVTGPKACWGESLLEAAARHVPVDCRKRIEGRAARCGIIRAVVTPDLMPDWPEAFVLRFDYTDRTFTIETPSEFCIDDRVAAQRAVINRAMALCRKEFAGRAKEAARRVKN